MMSRKRNLHDTMCNARERETNVTMNDWVKPGSLYTHSG